MLLVIFAIICLLTAESSKICSTSQLAKSNEIAIHINGEIECGSFGRCNYRFVNPIESVQWTNSTLCTIDYGIENTLQIKCECDDGGPYQINSELHVTLESASDKVDVTYPLGAICLIVLFVMFW